jgi:acyl-CoA synthetase (NDP forming)/GNAT superfamily N-acetyltransferase
VSAYARFVVPAAYPTEFEFDVLLKDGGVIHLRPITPEDSSLEAAFISRVGPRSMYQRFFRAKKDLTPEELRYFTTVDYDERMALIALDGDRMVAVGRYDVTSARESDGGRVAEVAFLVEDRYQGRGIGALLLQHLTVYARLKGVTEFKAFVLADNFGMMRLFRSSGYKVEPSLEEDVYRVEFPTEYSIEARAADWEHERRAVTASLTPLFYPRTVAVVGAEQGTDHPAGRLLKNLLRGSYTGIVHPVNPERGFVHSVKCYPSVGDIPDDVDLAFISVAPEEAIDAVGACGARGVRAVVVTSATSVAPDDWQTRLLRATRRSGMRMLGPDSAGVVVTNAEVGLHGHTGTAPALAGRVGLATQSGAISTAILQDAVRFGCGLSSFVSLGTAGDVTANDLVIYWEGDPFTSVIALYVESVGSARRFGRLARRVSRHKPIVAIKGGRTAIGSAAVEDAAIEALFRSAGVLRAETIHEMFDMIRLLSGPTLPMGRRIAVVGDAPGPASLAARALEAAGLDLPAGVNLASGEFSNPAVVPGERLGEVADALRQSGSFDAVVVVQVPEPGEPAVMGVDVSTAGLPVVAVQMGISDEVAAASPLPVYPYPESAARALAAAVRYAEWRSRPEGAVREFADVDRPGAKSFLQKAVRRLGDEGGALDQDELHELLHRYRVPFASLQSVGRVAVTMREDPLFGPLVGFRMSGEVSRLAGDQSVRINPLTDLDAAEMIREVRSAGVLLGGEGRSPADVAALEEMILRVSCLVEDHPEIVEIQLDPVAVGPVGSGVSVESARVLVRPLEGSLSPSRKDVPGRML